MSYNFSISKETNAALWCSLMKKGGYDDLELFVEHLLQHETACQDPSTRPTLTLPQDELKREPSIENHGDEFSEFFGMVETSYNASRSDTVHHLSTVNDETTSNDFLDISQANSVETREAVTSSPIPEKMPRNDQPPKETTDETLEPAKPRPKTKKRRKISIAHCTTCKNLAFVDHEHYKQHMYDLHSHERFKNGFRCDFCKKEYASRKLVTQHIKNSHFGGFKWEKCEHCDKKYTNKQSLQNHMGKHTGDMMPCPHCDKKFSGQASVLHHIKSMHQKPDESELTCDVCQKVLSSLKCLRDHKKLHEEPSVFCPQCNKAYSTSKGLRKHLITEHGGEEFFCKICSKYFKSKWTLDEHNRMHQDKPYKCACDKSYTTEVKLQKHIAFTHMNEKPHTCHVCGESFKYARTLETHLNHHSGTQYPCDMCSAKLNSADSLRNHKKTVHDESRGAFPCEKCGKTYVTISSLKYHIREYHPEKEKEKVKCELCGKTFRKECRMRAHQRTAHFDERRFACDVCGKRFLQKATMENHAVIHTGERPYICDVCGDTFRQSAALFTHKKLVHQGVKKDRTVEQPPPPQQVPPLSANHIMQNIDSGTLQVLNLHNRSYFM